MALAAGLFFFFAAEDLAGMATGTVVTAQPAQHPALKTIGRRVLGMQGRTARLLGATSHCIVHIMLRGRAFR